MAPQLAVPTRSFFCFTVRPCTVSTDAPAASYRLHMAMVSSSGRPSRRRTLTVSGTVSAADSALTIASTLSTCGKR